MVVQNDCMKWYIGCSGFSYKEWKDSFYPPKTAPAKWFEYYCTQFTTLEINLTFYNFPKKHILENWYNKSPAGFIFSVKAPRLITHYKQLQDVQSLLKDFYTICKDGLKEKFGPVLFQFPAQFSFTEKRQRLIIDNLSNGYTNVVEFRHAGWWDKHILSVLAKNNIIVSGISHPLLPGDIITSTQIMYYRFHGVPKLYYSGYSEDELKKFADHVLKKKNIKEVFCYFNNTALLEAISNARFLETYISDK